MRLRSAKRESLLDMLFRKGVGGSSYNGLPSQGTPSLTSKSGRAENCSCQHDEV